MCEDTANEAKALNEAKTLGNDVKPRKDRITLNIGGETFVTTFPTLSRHKGTRLSSLSETGPAYDSVSKEYYFDRSPKIFVYILDYYRNGELHFPKCTCGKVVKEELDFWKIPETSISECCWLRYQDYYEEEHSLENISHIFDETEKNHQYGVYSKETNKLNKWRHWIWLFLECPDSSFQAKLWSLVYMVLVLMSIGILCVETHPMFRVPTLRHNVTDEMRNTTNPKLLLFYTTELNDPLLWMDTICISVFVLEYLVKLLVWPHHKILFINFYNVVDFLSVFPMFALAIIDAVSPGFWVKNDIFSGYCILSLASVLRAIRILKVAKYNRGIQIMFLSIKACWKELLLLVTLVAIGMVIFSTMIYYAEFQEDNNTFPHIPIGFWWSVVTMTTVGYGDKHPSSSLGYLVGAACALAGMLVTGLPIPMIANSFNNYYTYAKVKARIADREKKAKQIKECTGTHI